MRHLTALTLGTMFLTLPLAAQTLAPRAASVLSNYYGPPMAARQAVPEEVGYRVVPSPMLLDISLGAYGNSPSLKDMNPRSTWNANTSFFVCANARLDWVEVAKDHYPGRYELTVRPTIRPELPGRTIGLTVAIVSYGQEIQGQTLNVDTRGALVQGEVVQAQGCPSAEFHFQFTEQEFASLFDRGQAPLLRIILDVR